MDYRTFAVESENGIVTVTLDRPDVHNAFNDDLIAEAIDLFRHLSIEGYARAVILAGKGPNFCAGADLNWMSRMSGYTHDENVADASQLAKMFATIDEAPFPVVGRIQGAAIGGGVGLVSTCDIAIATANAKFGLSEVKLGIIPAVISPYVISKIGETHARALFLTGERFGAERALQIGLVHQIVADEAELDAAVQKTVKQLLSSGPEAVRECKKLIRFVARHDTSELVPYTIDAIAVRRASDEGRAGMQAFLAKEKAPWVHD